MARVDLAHQLNSSGIVKPCVVKQMLDGAAASPEVKAMFLEEARLSAILNHPNIVQTFDFGEIEGVAFLVLELVDGFSLGRLNRLLTEKNTQLPPGAVVELGLAVAEALSYAHELEVNGRGRLNVVHRDVSPGNILISLQGNVKLADFGIARHDAREFRTMLPVAKGKMAYMAPEQAFGARIDGRADLFALGIVLTEALISRRVRPPGARIENLPARIDELLGTRADIPASFVALLKKMTELNPELRPASAREVATALRAIQSQCPPGPDLRAVLAPFHSEAPSNQKSPAERTLLGSPPSVEPTEPPSTTESAPKTIATPAQTISDGEVTQREGLEAWLESLPPQTEDENATVRALAPPTPRPRASSPSTSPDAPPLRNGSTNHRPRGTPRLVALIAFAALLGMVFGALAYRMLDQVP